MANYWMTFVETILASAERPMRTLSQLLMD
jgi:hypothetical protein